VTILDILRDLPGHLALWTTTMGPWIYVLLFAIIFAETGLVVTPFLPGDSLLFAIGALTAIPNGLDFGTLAVTLIAAALIGDTVNYNVGRWLGPKLFNRPNSKILNPAHLKRTQDFYLAYGGKTIVLARFLPILRTYAPFAAGLARLHYPKFLFFSIFGGVIWILSFLTLGHFFANNPEIKANFHYVIVAIIVISLVPVAIEFFRSRRAGRSQA
jgi:membrane-associated protein